MKDRSRDEPREHACMRRKAFAMRPFRDAIALSNNSPIGCFAMRKKLNHLELAPLEHVELANQGDMHDRVHFGLQKRAEKDFSEQNEGVVSPTC